MAERGLELQRLVDRLAHEALDRLLTPGAEHVFTKSAPEPLDAGEADAADLVALAVEDRDARFSEDALHLVLLPRLVIMVAEHGEGRDAERRAGHRREDARLVGESVVGQVAAEEED